MESFILKVSFCFTVQKFETETEATHWRIVFPIFFFVLFMFISLHLLAREILPLWDKQIQSLCYQVNGVIEKIGAAEPDWMAKTLDEQMAH